MNDVTIEQIQKFRQQFRFKYAGGGHFRDASIPKGTTAQTVHGDEVINQFVKELIANLSVTDNLY